MNAPKNFCWCLILSILLLLVCAGPILRAKDDIPHARSVGPHGELPGVDVHEAGGHLDDGDDAESASDEVTSITHAE